MTASAYRWNPLQVLKNITIDPDCTDFRCVGFAYSKKRKCTHPINKDNRSDASMILQRIGEQSVHTTDFDVELESLARCLLCQYVHVKHESQVSEKVRQWKQDIARHRTANPTRSQPNPQDTLEPLRREVNLENTLESLRREMDLQETLESLRREMRTLQERYTNVLQLAVSSEREVAPSASHAIQRVDLNLTVNVRTQSAERETHESELDATRTERGSSVLSAETEIIDTATREETTGETAEEREEVEQVEDEQHQHQHQHQHQQEEEEDAQEVEEEEEAEEEINIHQTHTSTARTTSRRSIEGECHICCDDITNGPPVSWCRAQCGQNFHAGCVGEWLATQREAHRIGTCPFCRAQWID